MSEIFFGHTPGTVKARCVECGKPFSFHSQYPKFDMQKNHTCLECVGKHIRAAIRAAGLDKSGADSEDPRKAGKV